MPDGHGERTELEPAERGAAIARAGADGVNLAAILGRNLKRLRTRQGYSLDRLAQLSGVSRAMIGQIETAKSVPTIGLLSRVAKALDVEFANLLSADEARGPVVLRGERARWLQSSGGRFGLRALVAPEKERWIDFHEVRIAPGHSEESEAHAAGTREHLVVVRGTLDVAAGGAAPITLGTGDALQFEADVPHAYRNPANGEAVFYVVTTYAVPTRT